MSRRLARGVGIVFVVGIGVAACTGVPAARSPMAPTPSATAEAVTGEANDPAGPYKLTFEFPKSVWAAGEPITARAELSYLGLGVSKVFGSGSGSLIAFGLDELNGSRDMGPARTSDCAPYTVSSLQPFATGLTKSGAFDSKDPNAAFWQGWFADRSGYKLPAGDWAITANATFDVGECRPPEHQLNVTLRIHITD